MIGNMLEAQRNASRGDRIRTVTTGTFQQLILEGQGPIVVEFMSYGCAHCRILEPVLQQVAEVVKAREKIFRVNIAVEPDLASFYEILGTPTLLMFSNGVEVGRVDGLRPTLPNVLKTVTQPFEA